MGPADPNEPLSVTIVVRRRSDAPPLLDPEYWRTTLSESRKFLAREEFAASYSAADEDLQRVADFARSRGLTVEETSIPRRTVVVSGTVVQFNDAFAVELGRYESPDQTYRGRDGSIRVPTELVNIIEGVLGLDNRRIGGHNSGPGGLNTGTLTPPQVAELYNFPTGKATGQTIGILAMVEDAGYTSGDIQTFFNSLGAGFTAPTIVDINIDNQSNNPGHNFINDKEVTGDICVASAVAQGATIAIYFAPCTQKGWVDAIGRVVHPNPGDPTPSVLSTSWYLSRGDDAQTLLSDGVTTAGINVLTILFLEAAWLGMTVFASCGDKGSDSGVGDGKAHVQYPGSDPWVTSCGGTAIGNVLRIPIDNVRRWFFTEVTWNDGSGATGGGVSDFFPVPYYQRDAGVPNSANDNQQRRGVPDIAGNASANSGYLISVQGTSTSFGGTSAVAPLYAGLIAVINARMGRPTGFLNNTLYVLGGEGGVFNDINDGTSNAFNGVPGYTSGTGWDACTGWGSINGQALLEALRVVTVRVRIDNIRDLVPGTPEQMALVQTNARVKMGDLRTPRDDTYLTPFDDGNFESFEKAFYLVRTISIDIEIWRNTSQEVKHGQVETINGQRYIVFGPNEKYPVPPDWDRLTPVQQAEFSTIIITPTVSPGMVERFTLNYDLRTHQISGDITGSAGQQIHAPDPINPFTPEIWFTISQT